MTRKSGTSASPSWMSDARLRRAIAGQIRQRRAKRKRELAKLETEIRLATRPLGSPLAGQALPTET